MASINLQKIFEHLVLAFVVVATFFYIPFHGNDVQQALEFGYMAQNLFFRYGVLFLFGFSLLFKPIRNSNLKWFGIFFVYCLLLAIERSFDIQLRSSLLNVGAGLLFIKLVADNFSTESFKKIGLWFFAVLLFNLFFVVQQYYKIDPLFYNDPNAGAKDILVGLMKAKVHLGTLAAILSPFVFSAFPILSLVSVPLLCVANSSVAVASFVLSIGFLFYFKVKKLVFVLTALSLLGIGTFYVLKYDMPGGQFTERFKIWNDVYGLGLKTHPFVGNGIGSFAKLNFETIQGNNEPIKWDWVHNEYVQAFYELGAFGLAIIIFYLKSCFSLFLKNSKDKKLQVIFSALFVVSAISFFHFPFHIARLAAPCLFILGLYHARLGELFHD